MRVKRPRVPSGRPAGLMNVPLVSLWEHQRHIHADEAGLRVASPALAGAGGRGGRCGLTQGPGCRRRANRTRPPGRSRRGSRRGRRAACRSSRRRRAGPCGTSHPRRIRAPGRRRGRPRRRLGHRRGPTAPRRTGPRGPGPSPRRPGGCLVRGPGRGPPRAVASSPRRSARTGRPPRPLRPPRAPARSRSHARSRFPNRRWLRDGPWGSRRRCPRHATRHRPGPRRPETGGCAG
jgi:hypothetical protein